VGGGQGEHDGGESRFERKEDRSKTKGGEREDRAGGVLLPNLIVT